MSLLRVLALTVCALTVSACPDPPPRPTVAQAPVLEDEELDDDEEETVAEHAEDDASAAEMA